MSYITDALEVLRSGTLIDLTHTVHSEIPRFSAFPKMTTETLYTVEKDGFHAERVSMVTQYGTHIDPPKHFIAGGRGIDEIALEDLMLPLCVIHKEKEVTENPDYTVSVEDLLAWEKENGRIPPKAFVAFSSNWSKRWESGDLDNLDANGDGHSPGWSLDALKFLVEERDVAAIGHETLDTDAAVDVKRTGFIYGEKYILGQNRYQVEVMTNLDLVPSTGAVILIGLPKFRGLPGFPVRAVAIVPKN